MSDKLANVSILEEICKKVLNKEDGEEKVADRDVTNISRTNIESQIEHLKRKNFDSEMTIDGKRIWIKKNNDTIDLNPISPHEAQVQALQYIQAMYLIIDHSNSNEDIRKSFEESVATKIEKFYKNSMSSKDTALLAEEFAKLIQTRLGVDLKAARMQLTMARDLALMQVKHPAVCTISRNGDKISAEYAENGKIDPKYYDHHFKQDWLQGVKKNIAGFKQDSNTTWLDNFFDKSGASFKKLQEVGCAAPPSARWLELPGNMQHLQQFQGDVKENQLQAGLSSDFVRIGTLSPFLIKDINKDLKKQTENQEKLAIEQLKEIIKGQIKERIRDYQATYGELAETKPTFYVDYVNILSPLKLPRGEDKYKHDDNNTRFIKIAKHAILQLSKDQEFQNQFPEVNLEFSHTNSAVNKNANKSVRFSRDKAGIRQKLNAASNLLNSLINHYTKQADPSIPWEVKSLKGIIPHDSQKSYNVFNTINEKFRTSVFNFLFKKLKEDNHPAQKDIMMRLNAAAQLNALTNKQKPYNKLKVYQRKIMKASLELLTQGKQALKLVGCKSARDRTAILMGAVKTMQENPKAMSDWETLNKGIIHSLHQGQHFRAMSYHVSSGVKVDDVHKNFMKQLDASTQQGIKDNKKFTKVLEVKLPKRIKTFLKAMTSKLKAKKGPMDKINEVREKYAMTLMNRNKIKK